MPEGTTSVTDMDIYDFTRLQDDGNPNCWQHSTLIVIEAKPLSWWRRLLAILAMGQRDGC